MKININTLPEALESLLSSSINACNESYSKYNKAQHGGTRHALKVSFNTSYSNIVLLLDVIVKDNLPTLQRLELDKLNVLHNSINNLNKRVDSDVTINHYTKTNTNTMENLVWCNMSTGEIEEEV
jgi:hypothetical protein